MATSNIPHLIYCIQYILLNSIVITLLVRIDRLPPSTPVPANGNGNMPVALDIHCPTHIHLALLPHDPTHLLWLPGLVRITGVGPEEGGEMHARISPSKQSISKWNHYSQVPDYKLTDHYWQESRNWPILPSSASSLMISWDAYH